MPTTTRTGPVRRPLRRPPNRPVQSRNSHSKWTKSRGLDTTYNAAGWLTSVIDGNSDEVDYDYDLAGNPTSIGYPNSQSVTRAYDDAGFLTSVTDWNSHQTTFGYDPDGNLTSIGYPNGVTETNTFSRSGALSEIEDATTGGVLADTIYTRNDNDQPVSASTGGSSAGPAQAYGYDALSRLDSYATGGGTPAPYGYDPAGNLTSLPDGTTQAFDDANELTSRTPTSGPATTYSYDPRGERIAAAVSGGATSVYGYDQVGQLTSFGDGTTIASYAYDGNGMRTAKTVGTTTSTFTWDQVTGSVPLLLTDATTAYVYGPGDLPIEQIDTGGTPTYLQHDQNGSTVLLTDASGSAVGTYTYTPYGETASHTGTATTSLRYDGQYQDDETGLYYLRARYYDPTTAQFLTRDPLEAETGAPYSYAGGDPLDASDPSGLDWCVGSVCLGFHPSDAINPIVNIGRGMSFGLSDKIANWISPGASCTVDQNAGYQALGTAATVIATLGAGGAAGEGASGASDGIPGLKPGWQGRTADSGKGWVWQEPGASGNANSMRVMDPTPDYPNGYVRFYNDRGQPVDLNGKPTGRVETHIPRNGPGGWQIPSGW